MLEYYWEATGDQLPATPYRKTIERIFAIWRQALEDYRESSWSSGSQIIRPTSSITDCLLGRIYSNGGDYTISHYNTISFLNIRVACMNCCA